MSRRDNADKRCDACAMHQGLCICKLIPAVQTHHRLCLVIHYREARKTTNTGDLALRCLPKSERIVHGLQGTVTAPPTEPHDKAISKSLLLYPGDEAEPLTAAHASSGPIRLVVPDGNWRQAAKMTRRIEWMASLPRVTLPAGQATSYLLRHEPKMEGLATMEAIARAFGILESDAAQKALEEVFRIMVDRTLYSRGQIARERVHGGVPEGFHRHLPSSG
jgi:DTW domain-containing protein YfiP